MMNKKLIIVTAPPACGKTYLSERLVGTLGHTVILDKDDLGPLVRAAFSAAGQPADMDGDFYKKHLRSAEYATILHQAFSTLRFEDRVLLNAPFGTEIRDVGFMQKLKERAHKMGAALLVIWVTAPLEVCHQRMLERNAERDRLKLQNWEAYVQKINYDPPLELERAGAVDGLLVFDTKDEATFQRSFEQAIKMIKER